MKPPKPPESKKACKPEGKPGGSFLKLSHLSLLAGFYLLVFSAAMVLIGSAHLALCWFDPSAEERWFNIGRLVVLYAPGLFLVAICFTAAGYWLKNYPRLIKPAVALPVVAGFAWIVAFNIHVTVVMLPDHYQRQAEMHGETFTHVTMGVSLVGGSAMLICMAVVCGVALIYLPAE